MQLIWEGLREDLILTRAAAGVGSLWAEVDTIVLAYHQNDVHGLEHSPADPSTEKQAMVSKDWLLCFCTSGRSSQFSATGVKSETTTES